MNIEDIFREQYILASKSDRRKTLLRQLGIRFKVIESYAEEVELNYGSPVKLVRHNSKIKAEAVAERVKDKIIIAADTVVYLDGFVFHKPKDEREAVKVPRRPHERDCGLAGDVRPGLDAPVSVQPDAVRSDDRVDGVDLYVARGGDRQQVRVVELGGGLAQPCQIDEDRHVSLGHARTGPAGVFAQVRGGSGQP